MFLLSQTFPANPCPASTWPRPLCGPLPLAEVWTGTGNRTSSGEVRRWRYLSRHVTMSRCHETGHRLSRAAALGCCHPLDISSDLLPPFPDFLKLRSQSFHLCELHSSIPHHVSYIRKLLYTIYCCYFCPFGSYFDIFFWFLRYFVPS